MIVDQYAAHERILYERALQALSDGFGLSQQLLFPRTVELSAADFALIGDLLADQRSLGFDLDRLSGRTVLIRGVPADIRTGDERTVLEEVLEQFRENARIERLGRRENLARSIARRSAIRAGTRLDELEMRALIDQLFQCAQPYAGPDGRPTLVRIPVDELDRRFGRRR
jgi:DNA mismatch repair protein MutL